MGRFVKALLKNHPVYSGIAAVVAFCLVLVLSVVLFNDTSPAAKKLSEMQEKCKDKTGSELLRVDPGNTLTEGGKDLLKFTIEYRKKFVGNVDQGVRHETPWRVRLTHLPATEKRPNAGSIPFVYFGVSGYPAGVPEDDPFRVSPKRTWPIGSGPGTLPVNLSTLYVCYKFSDSDN